MPDCIKTVPASNASTTEHIVYTIQSMWGKEYMVHMIDNLPESIAKIHKRELKVVITIGNTDAETINTL